MHVGSHLLLSGRRIVEAGATNYSELLTQEIANSPSTIHGSLLTVGKSMIFGARSEKTVEKVDAVVERQYQHLLKHCIKYQHRITN